MSKTDFLLRLERKLKKYGVKNANDYIDYYSEYLDDLVENGMSETAAVAEIGGVKKVLLEILSDENVVIPQAGKRTMGIFFLMLGLPLWGPIAAAIYIIFLAIIFALLVSALAFIVAGLWTFIGSFIVVFKSGIWYAGVQLGISMMLLGLGITFEQLFVATSSGLYKSSKNIFQKIHTEVE
ncbi:hypothetical protein LCR01_14040 [Companilactobacillus crustorum]|nr:DUF1700 domain-containing protein [Companilactobacillus crustorum]WDT66265.1 DUF1700 domain-containing protein [Companilactobacillus crustorum]GEO76961.1 hypothetical protein LCR01_14040 [Companilactobacillus crustorum]